ncbi:MAG: HNH endonuclease [Candidatus Micrarchaeota archaeon]
MLDQESMYIDDDGYPRFKDTDMLVHRWVMSKKIGRSLTQKEVVHHIDGNPLNYHPNNLKLFASQTAHLRHHKWLARTTGSWYGDIFEYTIPTLPSLLKDMMHFIILCVVGIIIVLLFGGGGVLWSGGLYGLTHDTITWAVRLCCFPIILLLIVLYVIFRRQN